MKQHSSLSSGAHSQAAICMKLGIIDREADYNDDTMRAYLQFFRKPMSSENVTKLARLSGVSSSSQLQLPDAELQTILEELSAGAV